MKKLRLEMLPCENVRLFHHEPKQFEYDVFVNDIDINMAEPNYHRTPVINVYTRYYVSYYVQRFYSKIHFMNYLKYWKISIDSLPTNFVKAIDTLCARPQFVPFAICKYSRITVNL